MNDLVGDDNTPPIGVDGDIAFHGFILEVVEEDEFEFGVLHLPTLPVLSGETRFGSDGTGTSVGVSICGCVVPYKEMIKVRFNLDTA